MPSRILLSSKFRVNVTSLLSHLQWSDKISWDSQGTCKSSEKAVFCHNLGGGGGCSLLLTPPTMLLTRSSCRVYYRGHFGLNGTQNLTLSGGTRGTCYRFYLHGAKYPKNFSLHCRKYNVHVSYPLPVLRREKIWKRNIV